MLKPAKNFSQLISRPIDIKIVDIGANPIDGEPPYAGILERNQGHVIGFEPNPAALATLNERKGARDTYLPHAVGDGEQHTLHICAAPGMTSLLEPNTGMLNLLHGFPVWGRVIATERVQTVRLADVPEVRGVNYLKMDIQGAELMVLRNAGSALDDVGVLHLEVEFLPLYKDQPLFADVETFLRGEGFAFHRFFPLVSRMIQPMNMAGDLYAGMSQSVWADAIFIRDLAKLDGVSVDNLISAAAILHDCYQSFDVTMHLLHTVDKRTGSNLAMAYLTGLKGVATPPVHPGRSSSIVPPWRNNGAVGARA